ncbi:MAG: S9 family peptidase [Muribaculaceae bacterium]|nr:S9 family peptidase [Muribaculaceae bacterium]
MNKTINAIIMSASAMLAAPAAPAAEAPLIDRPDFHSQSGVFDIDALEALGRVSSPCVSPDGKTVLFSIGYESLEQNASNNDLYTLALGVKNAQPVRLTATPKSESGAVWFDSGRRIAFLYPDADGAMQMWGMNADGSERTQLSNHKGGISGFLLSPDEKKIVVIGNVKYARSAADLYPDLPKATGRVVDDLMYKHWDEWVTEIPHPFVGNFDGKAVTDLKDIMADEPYEAPMKPFGGVESFAWHPNSEMLVYVSRKKTGLDYAVSTNSDLYLYHLESGRTRNLTEGMEGYDTMPAFSPDGEYLAWLSMERDGYESDRNRLFLLNCYTAEKRDITADWDYSIDEFAWAPEGKSIYFIAPKDGVIPVFAIDVNTSAITKLTDRVADFTSLAPAGRDRIVTMCHSMLRPNELQLITLRGKKAPVVEPLTDVNGDVFAQVEMPTVEKRMVPTTDGKQMLVWVVYPPHFDATKKYPAILYCQGGPQQPVSQFWSYRWNLALMGANGYIVIAPNRRGLPGFGTEWNEQISKDYPGQNMQDYLAAVDNLKAEPYVDEAHIGATGASYGGFSVYNLAGIHEHRFAALLAHAGIFNMEAQYLETEEMWFANWDMGGAYWEKDNAAAQRTFANSPHRFVDRWDTPIMISHGEYDYRILASQGMAAFNAAKLRGIPAEMVIFPDENHWILKPQNAVLWQRLFFRWFDKWLKPAVTDAK